ncbi:hypothetical protein CDD81_5278 [Ophiocordyceps australis]|uniref:HD/PDEase domain-containing protein n=1 Tax=Ophiocordyceps australis TaxID=1399860 RepID=A0A2C5YGU1_9HYPO|nr:hypothetical protein CDD81_5278 [Ophiocordyceps australis]
MASAQFKVDDALVAQVTDHVKAYMSHYDGSHDFNHIQRVLRLALHIQSHTPAASRPVVTLCALLHDVGDAKYLQPGQDAGTMVRDVLLSFGADGGLAAKVQTVCLGVSYSAEMRHREHVARLIEAHPELAVVQDADRLDALGAVGIGRAFAFGGARGRQLGETMDHFEEKLLRLEGMMKTAEGRRLARVRTARLEAMQQWWLDETEGVSLD